VRERVGHHVLELPSADYYASFVWDARSRSFGNGVWLAASTVTAAKAIDITEKCLRMGMGQHLQTRAVGFGWRLVEPTIGKSS
jgi:hypothetical protein